jgi:hypothetical protein
MQTGTARNAGAWYGPGSAAHHAAKGRRAALRPGNAHTLSVMRGLDPRIHPS